MKETDDNGLWDKQKNHVKDEGITGTNSSLDRDIIDIYMSTTTELPNEKNHQMHRRLKFNVKDRYNYDKVVGEGQRI